MKPYSVLMSVYFKEKPEFLAKSIESILDQTYKTNDFVIVCDGDLTEELNAVLTYYEENNKTVINVIRYSQNRGLGYALGIGLANVKNDIVMRMDSDDIAHPKRAEIQVPFLNKYDLVGSWVTEFDGLENNIISTRKTKEYYTEIKKYAKKRCPFNHPSVVFSKKVINDCGGYQTLLFVEDYYLWIRVLLNTNKVYNIQSPLVNMRSGIEMRARRGGKQYIKSITKLRNYMLKNKFINIFEYIIVVVIQTIFLLTPIKIKALLYSKFLRKK